MPPTLAQKIDQVLSRIQAAAKRSKRDPETVQLIAVTKGVPTETIKEALACGLTHFGENRVAEAAEKIPLLPKATWHLIGHLQSRKVKAALPLFSWIHSVDSLSLVQALDEQARQLEQTTQVLFEVNVSGEKSKYGFDEKQLWEVLPALENYPRVRVHGLMTLPPLSADPETSRPYFRRLREIAAKIQGKKWPFVEMQVLSMGMSQDFEVAVEEGAHWVRVGRALFGSL